MIKYQKTKYEATYAECALLSALDGANEDIS